MLAFYSDLDLDLEVDLYHARACFVNINYVVLMIGSSSRRLRMQLHAQLALRN